MIHNFSKIANTILAKAIFSSCMRNLEPVAGSATAAEVSAAGVCDFDQNEGSLTNAGWTKIFEEPFGSDLSNWNIWTGGTFNSELQHYQASNLQVTGGAFLISAKNETVTGQVNPWDATHKTFNYTCGRIECKSNVSASKSNPRIRMATRIKLPAGYGMWPAFWSYGDPWPTQGEIDILEARGQEPFQY
jgi:beta-glucanase (GH16 family)